ncbi:multicopper oxidase domain-containing protein [Phycicoccus duodecadis]|uniref:Multicopper oxidase n=1 Tax=Phycicoccus duodecadis TaxID=173053 RepID=A0A2N3YH78_9MICO|nr:multicopper oxidase domain-containing protein [Phycicoccus duodecadis]PKW26217.1 multicopper oxidase [Phycicoccus duodecadis]
MSSTQRRDEQVVPGPVGTPPTGSHLSRRRALGLAGSAALVTGAFAWAGPVLRPEQVAEAAGAPADLYLAGTDGWMSLPKTPAIAPYHPDVLAPAGLSTYIFGFRNVTGMSTTQRLNQKNKAQHNAPLFWVDQYDENTKKDFRVQLTNLGLALRPDLFDAHTLHWHGFRNVIPFFDGEPSGSVSVRAGSEFTYVYRPRDPGTYMYHCHVEDVEHVHMGMTGLVFVRPLQNGQAKTHDGRTFTQFLYNDGDGSTGYDREFSLFLSEVWAEAHWADAHIQLPEWSDYRADFALMNGRVYPDTLVPNGPGVNPFGQVSGTAFDDSGDLIAPAGRPDLKYQPHSSLVSCNEGERVALRFANLGFKESAMTTTGLRMRVVGRDATPMRGRDGTDTSYETETLNIGPGESYDVVFTAPAYVTDPKGFNTYMLYNRSFARSNNRAAGGFGGQATEIRVHPPGGVRAQQFPNDGGI